MRQNVLLLAVIALSFLSCEQSATQVSFNIEVKTNKGTIVDEATVSLNDQEIGKTDASGRFSKTVNLPPESRQRIEITKDSKEYYYARYVDSFQVKKTAKQNLNLEATLYFAPKPTADERNVVADTSDIQKIDQAVEKAARQKTETAELMEDPHELVKKELDKKKNGDISSIATEDDIIDLVEKEKPNVEMTPPKRPDPQPEAVVEPGELELTHVDPEETGIDTSHFKQLNSSKPKGVNITYTVHVYSGEEPIKGAQIFYGSRHAASLSSGCKTNIRGRCVIKFKNTIGESIVLLAKKEGFKSIRKTIRVKAQGIARFALKRGETIDIFTYQKTYNNVSGISEVQVYIDGKRVGSTDRFGHFSYVHVGQRSDLIQVRLVTKKALPKSYETDFVVAGPMSLVRYYTPKTPPPVKMTLMNVQPGGVLEPSQMRAFNGSLDKMIRGATDKSIFALTAYKKVSVGQFKRAASRAGRTIGQMLKKGWMDTDLKSRLDVAIVPTVIFNRSKNITLDVSLVDSKGKIVAAAKEILDNMTDKAAISQALRGISEKLTKLYAFEGAVVGKQDANVLINLGYSSGRGVRRGDKLSVFGIQSDKLGRKQNFEEIAFLEIVKVEDRVARAKIKKQKPRSLVQEGDLVVLRSRSHKSKKTSQIRVVSRGRGKHSATIDQANIYFNGAWLGATDDDGRLYLEKSQIGSKGLLKVLKYGYRDFTREVNLANRRVFEVQLVREMAFVRIDSEPKNAKVLIDGSAAGVTPLHKPIPIPSGFVKVQIIAPNGYKDFKNVIELERGTLDLTGANKIELEKDFRSLAMKRLKAGEYIAAIKRLLQVPREHSDYLQANHEIGEIYLTKLKKPARAAEAFSRVTNDSKVSQFVDKRFIGSHVNEGIALFMTAETLKKKEKATAQAHYLKAIEKLDSVEPQIRFVAKKQYPQASHNILYYRALSYQNLWYQTKDDLYLNQAYKYWRDYLSNVENIGKGTAFKKSLANAKVLFKQAKATIDQKAKTPAGD